MNSPSSEKLERRPTRRNLPEWQNGPTWPSWMVSFFVHCSIFLLLAWLWRPYSSGTQGERDRPIGIAVVHHQLGSTNYFLQSGGQGNKNAVDEPMSAALAKSIAALPATNMAGSISADELLGEFAGIGKVSLGEATGSGQGSSGLSGLGNSGSGTGKSKPGTTHTKVFGIEGSGSSFVYVFDRSESMNGYEGVPLRMAKRELSQSLASLTSVNQFQIIFYNDAPSPYRGSLSRTRGLIFATDTEKNSASIFVKGITGSGGTEHLPALQTGTNLGSDVIFFLTDAAEPSLSPSEVSSITERCISRRTTIHTIEFGMGRNTGSDRWIEQLAQRTGGKYRYVDVTNIEQ
ncbi:MAG: hypothetical protein SGI77_26045 [Pirellulaceae bacterium]|nr:hypothetical protein [Pirellulaceae bacterium]